MTDIRKNKIMNHTSAIILYLAGIVLLLTIVGLVYPYKTIDISAFRVESASPRPMNAGNLVKICWSFDKHIAKPALYAISLVPVMSTDLNTCYGLESGGVNSEPGLHETCKTVRVMEEVLPGEYKIRMSVTYRVNPIREITRIFYTDNTLIIDKQEDL